MNIYERFTKFECEKGLFKREMYGVKYWEYLRPFAHAVILEKCLKMSPNLLMPRRKIKNYFISLKNIKNYFLFKSAKDTDILFISHPRRFLQKGVYENLYIDKAFDYLDKQYKCLMLEEPTWSSMVISENSHLFPVYSKKIIFTDFYEFKYKVKSFILKKFFKNEYKNMLNEYDTIQTMVMKSFADYNPDNIDFKDYFMDCILRIKLMYRNTEKMIKKINPKLLLVHYFPSYFKTMIINICNRNSIPTVEVQHGTITADDPIVNKSKDVSLIESGTKYIFAFGKKHVDLEDLTVKKENVKYVGYPFLENKLLEKSPRPEGLLKSKKYILIVSQSTIGDVMSRFASELSEQLKDKKEYQIIFKYHPNELSRDYPCLNKANIIQIRNLKDDIYGFQKHSIAQIGVYSTALYEGLAFELPTFILDGVHGCEDAKKILGYMSNGVVLIKSAEEFVTYLYKDLNKYKPTRKNLNELWVNNSLKNLSEEVKKLF